MHLFNPIIMILHDSKLNRWHPIVFVEDPFPGPPDAAKPVRHRSKMHHTAGFDTRAAAVDNATNDLAKRVEGCRLLLDRSDIEWDGEGVPAMVEFFGPVTSTTR